MPTKQKYFLARVTIQHGEFEESGLGLVKAPTEAAARDIVDMVIKADNLNFNGKDSDFSWFGHATDEMAVHEKYDLRKVTPEAARILKKYATTSEYLNDVYPSAKAAVETAG